MSGNSKPRVLDPVAMGQRGLRGWQAKAADVAAPAIARRTRWNTEQIRAVLGWAMIALAVFQFTKVVRRVLVRPG